METLGYLAIHAHSGWRWIVLATLIFAIIKAFQNKKSEGAFDKKIAMFAMIAYHIQVLGGIVLLFVGPRVSASADYMKKMLMEEFGG